MKLKFLASIFFILVFGFWPLTIAHADPNGLKVEVYTYDPSSLPDRQPYTLCSSGWTSTPNLDSDWGGGVVADCQEDFVLIHYSGYLIPDRTGLVSLTSWADDGFFLSLNDEPVIDDWRLKGCSGSSALVGMTAGQSIKFDAWWYEYGGGACNRLYWDDVVIPASAFSQDAVEPNPVNPFLEAPTSLQADPQADGVHLSWFWQASETPVERFAVSWTYGVNPGWGIASLTNEAIITGLPDDTDITFWVRSDNDSLGVYSNDSEKVTIHTPKVIVSEPPVVVPVDPEPPVVPEPPVIVPETPEKPSVEPEPTPIPEPTLEPVTVPSTPEITPEVYYPPILSPIEEHQALMEALMEKAQEDDIQVSESISSIPVLGQSVVAVVNALNFIGNVGADMSPSVRHKAKQEVVAAVVVTQIAQFSTNQAVASAQASASSGSSGSTSKTRRNKE
jgi:hypothetical protein